MPRPRIAMIRYTVRPEHAERNEELVRAVYAQLGESQPAGLRYATFKLDDGVTFVHVARSESEATPLLELEAFQAFQENLRDRLAAPLEKLQVEEIGSYAWPAPALPATTRAA